MTLETIVIQVFGVVVTVISALLGYWVKRLHADLKGNEKQWQSLRSDLANMREQWAREGSSYVSRQEMQQLLHRIEQKLDRITDKLDAKMDKA